MNYSGGMTSGFGCTSIEAQSFFLSCLIARGVPLGKNGTGNVEHSSLE